jgi:hypothetical protein
MTNFEERFNALADEAQQAKDQTVEQVRVLLALADEALDALRAKGLSIRPELPCGVNVRLANMRFSSEFSRRLT